MTPPKPMLCQDGKGREFPTGPRWVMEAEEDGPIAATSTTAPGVVRTYSRWSTLTQETVDGRVREGVHFRFSDETAAEVGEDVARHDLRRLDRLDL